MFSSRSKITIYLYDTHRCGLIVTLRHDSPRSAQGLALINIGMRPISDRRPHSAITCLNEVQTIRATTYTSKCTCTLAEPVALVVWEAVQSSEAVEDVVPDERGVVSAELMGP